jgi:mono/diheme cytochrome c family protein
MDFDREDDARTGRTARARLPWIGLGLLPVAALALGTLAHAADGAGDAGAGFLAAGRAAAAAQNPDGKRIYDTYCAACHQANGEGTDVYPPLAGSEWVNGDEGRMIRVLLTGLTGEIEVAGTTFSGLMPGWGAALSDAELAAVATYVRSSWGNEAPAVAPETVARIRAATASRTAPWTAAELAGLSSSGQ